MAGLRISLFNDEKDNLPRYADFTWEEFTEQLLEHEFTNCLPCKGKDCEAKKGLSWSPAFFAKNATRNDKAVRGLSLATFDLDHLTTTTLEALCERLEGLDCVLHSTHSHHPPDDLALRLVFPLSRVVLPLEWPQFWDEMVRRYEIPADKAAKNTSRLYFFPTAPVGSAVLAVRGAGETIDVDEVLKDFRAFTGTQLGKPVVTVEPEVEGEVDLNELRKKMRKYDPQGHNADENREFIRRVLKGEPLAEEGARDNTLHTTMSILACLFPPGTPAEAAVELARQSIVSMPGDEESTYWLEKALGSYSRSHESRLQRDAAENELRQKLKDRQRYRPLGAGNVTVANSPSEKREETATEEADEEEEDELPWTSHLVNKEGKDGVWHMEQVGSNAGAIMEFAPEWKDVLRFNELTKNIEVHGGPLEKNETAPSQLPVAINNWIQHVCELRISNQEVASQMNYVARRHSYDPVKDYLLGLKWDGESRADFFMERCFGARLDDPRVGNITSYVRSVSAKWAMSAVARALEPGIKVDTVLVLEGSQGIKKSSAFKILAGEWFADSQLRLDDKDSKMLAAQSWIIELAELVSLRKSEMESYKSFLTSCVDKFRPPYGATVEEFKRRCVFVGTTNEFRYLNDLTGNRRFWPILCGEFNLKLLSEMKDQLWAEAVARFQAGEEHFWFSPEEQEFADQLTAARMKAPAKAEAIWAWWVRTSKEKRPVQWQSLDVAVEVLNVPASHHDERMMEDIERAMRYLGFSHERPSSTDQDHWVWVPTEKLRNVEKGTTKRDYLRMISTAVATKHDEPAGEV